ncbi:MAG TPA: N-acetylmuramoyl-L-alanine amidase [Phycisphaerae bacterium]|nr:N-acetylmuramoyl-L-alanine amidase [Phycisphaerae bacterium]HRY69162.1 N-acetylmuramoyl-L-alanine amidase [Phycisphaerae bacterium]HSA26123.1 N-acetylmuramoyl-L-alanine amidase [Phycisphaerae bacterium]
MLDPGHGGKDAGTWPRHSTTYPEKTLVLDIAKQIGQILVARNVRVIMTRTSDVYPSLEQRSVMADRSGADLFVSIHVNSAPRNRSASGVEAHIYSQATSTSSRAAQCIVAALKRSGIETRGIRRSDFHVLREHSRPAVLMECGFLTNPQDAAALDNGAYRAKLAAAIAEGITNFLAR